MRFWKCALRYWFLTSWTCLHENITGTWVFLDVQKLLELVSLRGKRDASVSKNLEAELCLFWNSDVGYENVIKFTIHYVQCCYQSFFFQFLSRPTTFAKRSGIQLGTESHRAWCSVLMSRFTTTLPASLASLSALWAASEMLTTLSANTAVKSNALVSSCFL